MLDSIKPGQNIRCVVSKEILRDADLKTVMRLMRLDPSNKRALTKAQETRVHDLIIRSRGKRPWEVRAKSSKIVRAVPGATWTMRYFPHVRPDFEAVAQYLTIQAA